MSAEIHIDDLDVVFHRKGEGATHALDHVDLDIAPGEFVSIVGPSGCGKTTLLRVLAGLQSVSSGTVQIDETPVLRPRRETCLMFQAPTLLPWLTVLDNTLLPNRINGSNPSAQITRAKELLARTGLEGFERKYPNELSGGMQQRVALCRALGANPSLLLLDEPFGALDAMTREQMNQDLHDMWEREGVTTLFITHSISEAVYLSQRVVVMSARPGRVVEIVDVRLPHHRTAAVMSDDRFVKVSDRIRSYFTREHAHD